MTQGGADRDPWSAPRWLRLEGLLATALLVPWQGEPSLLPVQRDDAKSFLDRLCSALSTSNAFALAWQALGLALVEPELRTEFTDTERLDAFGDPGTWKDRAGSDLLDKLDIVLSVAASVASVFEQRLRWAALHDLRSMLDNAIILPPVKAASLPQWWSKSTDGLTARAAEHLSLQLDALGLANLAALLRAPASPAFALLAAYMAQHIRRLSGPSGEFLPTETPSLVDRWVAELYVAARVVGRFRSDMAVPAFPSSRADEALVKMATAEVERGRPPEDLARLQFDVESGMESSDRKATPSQPLSVTPPEGSGSIVSRFWSSAPRGGSTPPLPALPPTLPPPRRTGPPRRANYPPAMGELGAGLADADPATVRRPVSGGERWWGREAIRRRFTPLLVSVSTTAAIALLLSFAWNRLHMPSRSDDVASPLPPGATVIAPVEDLSRPAPPVSEDPAADVEPCGHAVARAARGDFVEANHVFAQCVVGRFEAGAGIALHAQKAVEEHLGKGDCGAALAVIDAVSDVGVTLGPADERKLVACGTRP
ncbi:MAG TPA: hypothetical protein VK540_01355 [Polyangiaceae bacterium]|nr:hypothetical protein [Polyangiaceae bacterium]